MKLLLNHELTDRQAESFWAKVDVSDGCWNWTAATGGKGYGKFSLTFPDLPRVGTRLQRAMVSAHRLSYILKNGPIPTSSAYHGLCVLHRCDNPRCVRPDHLFLGTNQDNVRDMDKKGRRVNAQLKGEAHPNSVLTEESVREIVRRYRAGGVTQRQLARDFKVCFSAVNHIFTGRLWGHLGLSNKART